MKRILVCVTAMLFFMPLFAQNDELQTTQKMVQLMYMIDNYYTDTVNLPSVTEKGMEEMLKQLDPHSVYIPKKEVPKYNEPLQGNIDGIGVTFQILKDTIHIVDVIAGGPSEKVGLYPGDRIIKVDGKPATGDSISQDFVLKNVRGKKGTKVNLLIDRKGKGEMTFTVTRDRIPMNSIDTWFMVDDQIGYISLRRYAQNSDEEFVKAVEDLKKQGMKKLIFDLRSNGGGYLESAQKIVDEFIDGKKLIVYTQGIKSPRQEFKANKKGVWEKGDLVILTDEYTASASEITAGAVQDWDRGVIIGRRTFGKGLVQKQFTMIDGSMVRLTTSRYYIPSGRCIQRPYDDGKDEYYNDYQKRYQHKEMVSADSITFADSLKYETHNGRTVYGGGGVMPDVFVAMDITRASDYFINLRSKNLFNDFSLNFAENNRGWFLEKYPTYESFDSAWSSLGIMDEFRSYAEMNDVRPQTVKPQWVNKIVMDYLAELQKDSVKNNSYTSYTDYAQALVGSDSLKEEVLLRAKQEDVKSEEYKKSSDKFIEANLKGMIARNLYGIRYYYKATQENDDTMQQAIKILKDEKAYKSILKKQK